MLKNCLNFIFLASLACLTLATSQILPTKPARLRYHSCNSIQCGECEFCLQQNGLPTCVEMPKCRGRGPSYPNPCHGVVCGSCQKCVPAKRYCIRAPCPQYDCIRDPLCYSANPCSLKLCRQGTKCRVINGRGVCVPQLQTPLDPICRLPMVVGQCRAAIPSWYFNARSGKCQRFHYGGCDGNANRFGSKMLCDRKCVRPDDGLGELLGHLGQD